MHSLRQALEETVGFLKERVREVPKVAIILGSGLGNLTDDIEEKEVIPYVEIPHFPISTVEGHTGNLVFGKIAEKGVVAMQGRFHFYEGYSMQEVTFPVRVFGLLGIKVLIVSNAAGGVNPNFRPGDIMLIVDHINLMPENPLRGPNDDTLGPRFPSMHEAYSRDLTILAKKVALDLKLELIPGIYLALQGPNLETPAEYRMVRILGADAVGMSTAPEVIVANHMGIKVLGISVITNVANPYDPKPATHDEVVKVANEAGKRLRPFLREFVGRLVV
jgi:purine-nucleoside phosphorylase